MPDFSTQNQTTMPTTTYGPMLTTPALFKPASTTPPEDCEPMN